MIFAGNLGIEDAHFGIDLLYKAGPRLQQLKCDYLFTLSAKWYCLSYQRMWFSILCAPCHKNLIKSLPVGK